MVLSPLTARDGAVVYVNPDKVRDVRVAPPATGGSVVTLDGGEKLLVKEELAAAVAALSAKA